MAAQTGEPDRAIAALEELLWIPYCGALAANVPRTPALIRFGMIRVFKNWLPRPRRKKQHQ